MDGGGLNEFFGQKFLTGHNKGEKDIAKNKILTDIDSNINEMTEDFAYFNSPEKLKNFLIKKAQENNWKGKIEQRTSSKDGLIYITYVDGKSSFQDAVSPMKAGTEMMSAY